MRYKVQFTFQLQFLSILLSAYEVSSKMIAYSVYLNDILEYQSYTASIFRCKWFMKNFNKDQLDQNDQLKISNN